MFRWMTLQLFLCGFISYRGSTAAPLTGLKGGDVILPCHLEHKKIVYIVLSNQTEVIDICETKDCSGRVFREGSCDVIIKNLTLRDAGKYFLSVYYTNDQTETKRLSRTYHLHIHDEISVNTESKRKLNDINDETEPTSFQFLLVLVSSVLIVVLLVLAVAWIIVSECRLQHKNTERAPESETGPETEIESQSESESEDFEMKAVN
ncbi:uncharacterized protein [Pseudorasbora parva]|uniref:uncharacterized protein n=1 Tax=Pseudorasbora parva TaxID=51549 RepID=UPI00351F185D